MANEWLENLKVGDNVVVEDNRGRGHATTIERTTKTLFITPKHGKYKKSSGFAPGKWPTVSIVEPTKERLDRIQRRTWAEKLRNHKWDKESLVTLAKIVAIVTEQN